MTFEPAASPTAQDAAEALAKLGPTLIDSGAVDRAPWSARAGSRPRPAAGSTVS